MSEQKPGKKAVRIKIEIDEKLSGGIYCNLCLVNHSDSEFVMDAFFLQPQKPSARHQNRVVFSPKTAKRLYALLGKNLDSYEKRFGKIELTGPQMPEPEVQN
jgi:Protein of unknown function (DUF3467)